MPHIASWVIFLPSFGPWEDPLNPFSNNPSQISSLFNPFTCFPLNLFFKETSLACGFVPLSLPLKPSVTSSVIHCWYKAVPHSNKTEGGLSDFVSSHHLIKDKMEGCGNDGQRRKNQRMY
jgi:hypothetical protein